MSPRWEQGRCNETGGCVFHAQLAPSRASRIPPDMAANEVGEALLDAAKLLEQAKRAKSDFISRMSHEFRTPLNAILGFARIMEGSSPPPTSSQTLSLNEIIKTGWHLLDQVNLILDFAMVESGKAMLSREPVSLVEVMSECKA